MRASVVVCAAVLLLCVSTAEAKKAKDEPGKCEGMF